MFAGYVIDWSVWIAALAVMTSLIAAGVALYGSWRANKIAEKNLSLSAELEIIKLREKWLDDVRNQMVNIISVLSVHLESPEIDPTLRIITFRQSITRLLLLLPHDDVNVVEFIKKVQELQRNQIKLKTNEPSIDPSEVILLGKEILKTEWDRLIDDIQNIRDEK